MKLFKITLDPTLDTEIYDQNGVVDFQVLRCEVRASNEQENSIDFILGKTYLLSEDLPFHPDKVCVTVNLEDGTARFFADFEKEGEYVEIPCLVEWVDDFPVFSPIRNSPNPRQP